MLDLVAYFRSDKTLFRTKEIRSAYTFSSIPFDVRRSSVALFAAEVLLKVLRQTEAHGDLFPFVWDFVRYLDQTSHSIANFPVYFLVWMTDFLGFQPERPSFGAPYFFDYSQGYFLPEPAEHDYYSNEAVGAFLVALLQAPLGEVHQLSATRDTRSATLQTLLSYLQLQVEGFRGIASHAILSEVLQ
jgi:DNA repair protein RecO (recombination protein O)